MTPHEAALFVGKRIDGKLITNIKAGAGYNDYWRTWFVYESPGLYNTLFEVTYIPAKSVITDDDARMSSPSFKVNQADPTYKLENTESMTDRYSAFVVVLEEPAREYDTESILTSLRMIKGVARVEPIEKDVTSSYVTEMRIRSRVSGQLADMSRAVLDD